MVATRVISLDLDDTLWPVAPVLAAAEARLFEWLQGRYPRVVRGHTIESMRAHRSRIAAQNPERSHDLTFVRRHSLRLQFAAAGFAESLGEEALEVFLAARNQVALYADTRPALLRLRERHRLFAVSNGNADLGRCGVLDLFEGHVSAISAGAAKPDARIFAALCDLAGVAPEEILHVGDDPITDVVGARQAGMRTAWLNRGTRAWPLALAPPERTIATLLELV